MDEPAAQVSSPDLAPLLEAKGLRVICALEPGPGATVFKVRHTNTGCLQVLKLLPEDLRRHASSATDFRVAVGRLANCQIPSLVQTFGLVEGPGYLGALMEFVEGEDLGRVLGREGRLSPARAVCVTDAIAIGLLRARASSLSHGDLRPSSVLLASSGALRLLGLGLPHAMPVAPAGAPPEHVPYDIPLERIFGSAPLGPRADLYRLGFLLYHMLVGYPPFAHPNPHVALSDLRRRAWPTVRRFLPDAPPLLDKVVSKLSQRTDGYAGVDEVLLDLERLRVELVEPPRPVVVEEDRVTRALAVQGMEGPSAPQAIAPQAERPPSPLRLPIAFASTALLALCVVGPVFRLRREPPTPPPATALLPAATEVEGAAAPGEAGASEAEQAFQRAVRLCDSDPSDTREAVRRYREIVSAWPDTKWAAEAEVRVGEVLRRADAELDRAWERTVKRVDVLVEWEDFGEAMAEIDAFLVEHGDCRYVPDAVERRKQVEQKGVDWGRTAFGVSKALMAEGKWEEARAKLQRLAQTALTDEKRREAEAEAKRCDLALAEADTRRKEREHLAKQDVLQDELARVAGRVRQATCAFDFDRAEAEARTFRGAVDEAEFPAIAAKVDALARVAAGVAKARDAAVARISAGEEHPMTVVCGKGRVSGMISGASRDRVTVHLLQGDATTALPWDDFGAKESLDVWERYADGKSADEQLGLGILACWAGLDDRASRALERAAADDPSLTLPTVEWLKKAVKKK